MTARFGDRVALVWALSYTRGLPPEAGERRRDEIRSDLHEHAATVGPSLGQQVHVLGRVLWGIPADLSWRRATVAPRGRLAPGGTMNRTTISNVAVVVGVGLLAAFELAMALGVTVGAGGEEGSDGSLLIGLVLLAGAVLLVAGLATRASAPRRSTVLISVGAIAPMIGLYWMAPVFVVPWLVVTGIAFWAEPRPGAAPTPT